ncbi:hypothetical protein NW762_014845, partial [Fusarium torreyae]
HRPNQMDEKPTPTQPKTNQPTLQPPTPDEPLASPRKRPRQTGLPCTHLLPPQSPSLRSSFTGIPPSQTRLPYTGIQTTTHQKHPLNPYKSRSLTREFVGEIEAKDGLPSADRNNKATLLLTGPFRTAKSSAKDLTPLVLKLQYAKYQDTFRVPWKNRLLRR